MGDVIDRLIHIVTPLPQSQV